MADDYRPPGKSPITDREREVWHLLAEGMTDKRIAAQLGMAPNTVRVHVVSLAFKLDIPGGAQTRVLIARRWWERQASPAA